MNVIFATGIVVKRTVHLNGNLLMKALGCPDNLRFLKYVVWLTE